MEHSDRRSFQQFWTYYLLHHQSPVTRLLHTAGSVACLAGVTCSIATMSLWPIPISLVIGYLCAFGGHWWVERNQPMTFRYPLRAGLCNWLLFGVELRGLLGGPGFKQALASALIAAPAAASCASDGGLNQ